jgi:hypothetical protein
MSYTREHIDTLIHEKIRECGIKHAHIGWELRPAQLHILVNGAIEKHPISTRLRKSELDSLIAWIESCGRRGFRWDERNKIKQPEGAA